MGRACLGASMTKHDTEIETGSRVACRILVMGAAGTGTSTLARGLADRLATQAFDTDDFFWVPTDPPFQTVRPIKERLQLAEMMFLPRRDWVLGGSPMGWSTQVVARLTHVIFLTLDGDVRCQRLRKRETQRYGAAILPGGDMADEHNVFMKWAQGYDNPEFSGRNILKHRQMLSTLDVPVFEFDSAQPADVLLESAVQALDLAPGQA